MDSWELVVVVPLRGVVPPVSFDSRLQQDGNAKDLIDRLVQVDPSKRLGALKNGARSEFRHNDCPCLKSGTLTDKPLHERILQRHHEPLLF